VQKQETINYEMGQTYHSVSPNIMKFFEYCRISLVPENTERFC
jgi:hypothetical protein